MITTINDLIINEENYKSLKDISHKLEIPLHVISAKYRNNNYKSHMYQHINNYIIEKI